MIRPYVTDAGVAIGEIVVTMIPGRPVASRARTAIGSRYVLGIRCGAGCGLIRGPLPAGRPYGIGESVAGRRIPPQMTGARSSQSRGILRQGSQNQGPWGWEKRLR